MARKQQKQDHQNENVQQASGVDDTQNLTQDGAADQAPALTEETSAVEQADGASDTIGDPAASDDDATE